MKALISIILACVVSCTASAGEPQQSSKQSLFDEIAALDAAVFDAFNHCSDRSQLNKHASFFSDDVEFYHDTGGVTWNRKDMLANTEKNACGHYTRELIPGTLVVYPIKAFGAISQGTHRFCQVPSGSCEGLADFTMVWRRDGDKWRITRVLSYGHRIASNASQ